MTKTDVTPHHAEMMCGVRKLEYNFTFRRAIVHLQEGHCTDMEGAIAVVLRIDPLAREIVTAADGVPGVTYIRCRQEWRSVHPELFQWRPARRPLFEKSC